MSEEKKSDVQIKAVINIHRGRLYKPGEVLEVDEKSAGQLVLDGSAEYVNSRRQKDAVKERKEIEKAKRPRTEKDMHIDLGPKAKPVGV